MPNSDPTPVNHTLQGTLHLFLRAANDSANQRILLRGFAYWDSASKPSLWADLKLATPYEFNKVLQKPIKLLIGSQRLPSCD